MVGSRQYAQSEMDHSLNRETMQRWSRRGKISTEVIFTLYHL